MMRCIFTILLLGCSTVLGANLLVNPSFESGDRRGWTINEDQVANTPLRYSTADAQHGTRSIRLEFGRSDDDAISIVSAYYRLKANTQYTFSIYLKSSAPFPECQMKSKNTFRSNAPGHPNDSSFSNVVATASWARHSHTFTTSSTAFHTYQVQIGTRSSSYPGQYVYVDSAQLEQGASATTWVENVGVEVGAESDDATWVANAFYNTDTPSLIFRTYNYGASSSNLLVNYKVLDYWNREAASGTFTNVIAAGTGVNQSVTFPGGTNGSYRVQFWQPGVTNSLDEISYTVLEPLLSIAATNGVIGSHINMTDSTGAYYWLKAGQKVGYRWNRTLSTGRQFRWEEIEAVEGVFLSMTNDIVAASNHNFAVLGTIGSEVVHVPPWGLSGGYPLTNKWAQHLTNLVNAYKDHMTYYEIWNEPEGEGGLAGQHKRYGDLLEVAYDVIHALDPSAIVVGMVTTGQYMTNTFTLMNNSNKMDAISTHIYDGNAQDFNTRAHDAIAGHPSTLAFNSETGARTDSFYQTFLWEDFWSVQKPDDWDRDYRSRTDWLPRNMGQSLIGKLRHYHYYDGRNSTCFDQVSTFSLFEWDGTLRPKNVMLGWMETRLVGSTGYGAASLDPDVDSWRFAASDADPWYIVTNRKADEHQLVEATFTLAQEDVTVYNYFGHEIPIAGGIEFGRSGIIIHGEGISQATLEAGVSFSNVADTTAPTLSMSRWPMDGAAGDTVYLKWFGVDDIDENTRWAGILANSIEYSYYLAPTESSYSSWQSEGWATYTSLPDDDYTFYLRARDQAPNTNIITQAFSIGLGGIAEIVANITTVNATNVILTP